MTTYTSRETVRDALQVIFDADATWQDVFGYEPKTLGGHTPVMTITSAGTDYEELSAGVNPTDFRFRLRSYVLVEDQNDPDAWGPDEAEDKLDEIDKLTREVIRDNTPTGSYGISREDGFSSPSWIAEKGLLYRFEDVFVIAHIDA